jgi:hypothetical protein
LPVVPEFPEVLVSEFPELAPEAMDIDQDTA